MWGIPAHCGYAEILLTDKFKVIVIALFHFWLSVIHGKCSRLKRQTYTLNQFNDHFRELSRGKNFFGKLKYKVSGFPLFLCIIWPSQHQGRLIIHETQITDINAHSRSDALRRQGLARLRELLRQLRLQLLAQLFRLIVAQFVRLILALIVRKLLLRHNEAQKLRHEH